MAGECTLTGHFCSHLDAGGVGCGWLFHEATMPAVHELILIPGLLCTADLYAPQVAVLSASTRIAVANHTVAASISDIARVILASAPQRFSLCGLSMGGYLAFEIMRQAPERVIRLALLDTSAKPDTPERTVARGVLVARAEREGLGGVSQSLLPQWVHPRRLSDPALAATVARMAADTGVTHFARQQAAIAGRADSRPGLAAIKVPTLVLVGREDAATPVADAEEIARGISGSKLVVVEDCGHLSTLEQPGAVNRALGAWLEA
jgi:pimeloyl-ACP methyl ester carboxylesterase